MHPGTQFEPPRKFLLLLWCLSIGPCAYSQLTIDSAFITTASQNAIKMYQQELGAQSRLYNGSKYLAPEESSDYHAWFASDDWINGSVYYDGEYFEDVPLMYDLMNDAVVTEHFPSGHAIQLVAEKLRSFTLGEDQFEKIEIDSVSSSLPRSGFYQVLYGGKTKVISLKHKYLRQRIEGNEINIEYEQRNRYFMFRNGNFSPIKSKQSVLTLLSDAKQELRRFLKQKKISFRHQRELALRSLAEYYDTAK